MNDLEKAAANNLWSLVKKYERSIAAVIPKHLTPERVIRLIIGEINMRPQLAQCSQVSVINCVLTAASMGIEIRKNSAYMLPFNTKHGMEATLVIDYRSKVDLAIRSGAVEDIEARLVYETDEFELVYTDKERIMKHRPRLCSRNDQGKLQRIEDDSMGKEHVVLGYALAWPKGGGKAHIEPMTFKQIEGIRAKSKAKDNGPWVSDWEQMARKTLIHRICNYIPQSPELAASQDIDDRLDTGRGLDPIVNVDGVGLIDIPAQDANKPVLEQSAKASEAVAEARIAELKGEPRADGNGSATDAPKPTEDEQAIWKVQDACEARGLRRPKDSEAREIMRLDAAAEGYWEQVGKVLAAPAGPTAVPDKPKPVFGKRN